MVMGMIAMRPALAVVLMIVVIVAMAMIVAVVMPVSMVMGGVGVLIGQKSGSMSRMEFRLKPLMSMMDFRSTSPKLTGVIGARGFMCTGGCAALRSRLR